MRFGAPIAALTMIALAFAGCTGSGAAPARDVYAAALNKAQSYDSEAVLVDISGLEIADTQPMEDAFAQAEPGHEDELAAARALVPRADPKPGDGNLPAWGFVFIGADSLLFIAVNSAGVVTYERQQSMQEMAVASGPDARLASPLRTTLGLLPATAASSSSGMPVDFEGITEWTIDSSDAATIIAQNDPEFRDIATHANSMVAYELSLWNGRLQWVVMAMPLDEQGQADEMGMMYYTVDAMTGEFSDQSEPILPPGPTFLPREFGDDQGTLDALSTSASTEFRITEENHGALVLVLERTDFASVASDLRARVTSPDGTQYDLTVDTPVSLFGGLSDSEDVDGPADGTWQVEYSLETGATTDYAFYWCTDGDDEAVAVANVACDGS